MFNLTGNWMALPHAATGTQQEVDRFDGREGLASSNHASGKRVPERSGGWKDQLGQTSSRLEAAAGPLQKKICMPGGWFR